MAGNLKRVCCSCQGGPCDCGGCPATLHVQLPTIHATVHGSVGTCAYDFVPLQSTVEIVHTPQGPNLFCRWLSGVIETFWQIQPCIACGLQSQWQSSRVRQVGQVLLQCPQPFNSAWDLVVFGGPAGWSLPACSGFEFCFTAIQFAFAKIVTAPCSALGAYAPNSWACVPFGCPCPAAVEYSIDSAPIVSL